ncbi:TLD-domain-containing protein [Apiospora arundinis]
MHSLVEPNAWVAIKLPSENLRVLQLTPNTTISLGKYGSFPSNLIIHRPYHITYELEDKKDNETFNRLRIVPASELYSDILSSSSFLNPDSASPSPEGEDDAENAIPTGVEYKLVDADSGAVVAKTDRAELDAEARQSLTMEQIEELKKDVTDAGRDIITKLMLSHSAIGQKTEYSLAKYKLLKTKKYIRRFCVLPLDVSMLDYWLLEEKDPSKILDLREEMIGLLGCWANVHFGGEAQCMNEEEQEAAVNGTSAVTKPGDSTGRWLVVDDTGGLLVAAMAERMGVLYPPEKGDEGLNPPQKRRRDSESQAEPAEAEANIESQAQSAGQTQPPVASENPGGQEQILAKRVKYPSADPRHKDDLAVPYSDRNTMTLLHHNSQPNLSFLRYYDFDNTNPTQTLVHPLARHLMTLSWLQLLDPQADSTYANEPADVDPDELKTWKANRRGNYHRKRRRWARIRHVVDQTRSGGFSGLVVASTMDPTSIMRHAVPLLAGGAPIAIYSQTPEPLTALLDCYSVARRAAWISDPPEEAIGKTAEELEQWAGTDEFPLNPSLVLGAAMQTSRVRKWQVLPGRTHPLMTSKGGAEGYIFTAWRVKPAEGRVEARGKGRTRKAKSGR